MLKPSVIGIITIPGTMTGAILGGISVEQAAKLQMIIMFMITSASALAAIFTTFSVISIAVDGEHRIRDDRIDEKTYALWRWRSALIQFLVDGAGTMWGRLIRKREVAGTLGERTSLLS